MKERRVQDIPERRLLLLELQWFGASRAAPGSGDIGTFALRARRALDGEYALMLFASGLISDLEFAVIMAQT